MKTIYIIIALATFFCSECYSANRYWVGGTGNWSDNTNHWSASSGGAANASLPSASDNVYFDANSFSAGGQIVSIDADSYCNSMDWTGATNSPTINFPTGSVDLYVAGSLKFIGAMSLTQASASWIRLTSTTTGNTITTAGIAMPTTRFDGVGGEWTLQDNFTHNSSARSFRVVGTVITNGYSVSIGVLDLTATGVLTLSTSTLTISSTATIAGTTTISTGTIDANSTFNATGGTITFTGAGNLYLSGTTITSLGTFTCSTSTVTLDGSASQTINSSTDPNFYNLTLNNTSGGAIGLSTTVKNNFTFAAGATNFSLQGYTLTIGTATTDGTITGADADSYFVAYDNAGTIGKLKYFINNNVGYTYPIGDLSNYTPLTWTLNSNGGLSSAYLTVYTKAAPPTGMSASITEYLNRSWDVTSSGMTTPNYNISYTYIQTDVVSSETNFMPFKITGSTVVKPSNSSFTNYNSAEGTGSVNTGTNVLTWTGLTTFSMFGAAGNGAVALPVEILNFDVKLYQKNAKISWKTANEINNDYFTVEKSSDGINFRDLQIVDGSGNSNYTLKYSIIDHDATSGIYYYRLKQTDFNGEEKLSTIISIEIKTNTSEVIMTVNTLGQEVNESYSGIVFDIYSDGTSVKRIQ